MQEYFIKKEYACIWRMRKQDEKSSILYNKQIRLYQSAPGNVSLQIRASNISSQKNITYYIAHVELNKSDCDNLCKYLQELSKRM